MLWITKAVKMQIFKRPDKYVLPNSDLGVKTILRPSDEQETLISDIKSYIRGRKNTL